MTREEAIKELRCFIGQLTEGCQEVIKVLVPELAESEDENERMLQEIKRYIKEQGNKPTGLPNGTVAVSDMIAWLEKQGNPADKIEPKFKVGDWIVFNGLILQVKEVVKGFYRTISKGGITNSYDWGIDNAARLWTAQDAKEQKPTEKLSKEEYVKKFKALCDTYEIKLPNHEYDIYHLCKDLHKLFGDADIQKPAEWSQQDERKLQKCIEVVERWERDLDIAYAPYSSMLKSLHPQKLDASKLENFDPVDVLNRIKKEWPMVWEKVVPKQEWSEEEMKLLDSIIDDYEKASKSFCGYDGKIGFLKAIRNGEYNLPKPAWSEEDEENFKWFDKLFRAESIVIGGRDIPQDKYLWFKSLHPSWKPSEHQMTILKAVKEYVGRGSGYWGEALGSLIEDLEKL